MPKKTLKMKLGNYLVNKLRSMQNIDSEIEKLIIHRNELRLEINHLNTKKNEIEEPYVAIEEPYVDHILPKLHIFTMDKCISINQTNRQMNI